jgi:NAD(P)H dehydrogenase (quinone)
MRVVIIFNHPYDGSYCNAILNSVTAGLLKASHEVDLMHLDKDNFDPVMRAKDLAAFVTAKHNAKNCYEALDEEVMNYKQRLEQADHLIFIFPIWWELMPAMTKGFIDKVIFPGVAYDYKPNGFMVKRFKDLKGLTLITTMNTHKFAYKLIFGNAIKKAFFTGTFWKLGYKNRKWINLSMVKFVSEERRKKWLEKIEERFAGLK